MTLIATSIALVLQKTYKILSIIDVTFNLVEDV